MINVLFSCAALCFLSPAVVAAASAQQPVQLIIDTDLGFDVDDVGAISVALHAQDISLAEIKAILRVPLLAPAHHFLMCFLDLFGPLSGPKNIL